MKTFTPIIPTDLFGSVDKDILVLSEEVCIKSATLVGGHNRFTIEAIKELLRTINSYYSNKIESQGTHPLDIDRAMREEFFDDIKRKNLQILSLRHIEVQKIVEEYFINNASSTPFSLEFIKNIHKEFYSAQNMSVFLDIKQDEHIITMEAGEFRDKDVYVAKHIAPKHEDIESLMNQFSSLYKLPQKSTKALMLVYILASHHRLTWIHPFLDGNGRTARLALDGAFKYMNLDGYGLWNISRGLARSSESYKSYLALADMPRQGDYDGRGALSMKSLKEFVRFMLEISLDQIEFMSKNLDLATLSNRMEKYVKLSQNDMLDIKPLPKYTLPLLKELLICGELQRGKVKEIIGTKDRVATYLIKDLLELGYIQSYTPKGAIRLKINAHFGSYLIPELIPSR
jgi:Fic family protein